MKKIMLTVSTQVTVLDSGKSFGELALLHNKQRAASISTLEDTHFATMNKRSFERVMLIIKRRENDKAVQFLDNYAFIKSLTYQTKVKLSYFDKEIK